MMAAVKSKDLLILLLMVNYLATKCLAGRAVEKYKEKNRRGKCMELSACKYEGGKCYRDQMYCAKTDTVTKQCIGERNCACCIPSKFNVCKPKDENSCKPPNYCVSRQENCKESETRTKGACTRKVYNKIFGKLIDANCGCCIKAVKKERNNNCPRCGIQIKSKDDKTDDDSKRIAGGVEIKPKHKYPWLVLLKVEIDGRRYHCGGQIINSRYVLTAAHCLNNGAERGCQWVDSAKVFVGMHRPDLTDGIKGVTKEIKVARFIEHEDYQCGISHDNDIALLGLEEDLDLKSFYQSLGIGAICLPDDDEETYNDYRGTAAGWGATYATRFEKTKVTKKVPQDVPSEASMPIHEDLCYNYPSHVITDNIICSGDVKAGKDACSGDSGGPLMIQNRNNITILVGVTSFGPTSGECNGPGAYTRVNQYLDWIEEKTNDIQCNMLYAD